MATTRRCRCWPGARPPPGGPGSMSATTAPFGGPDPPAALFHYSRDRSGDHPVEHLRTLHRDPPGRRLCRLQPPLCGRKIAGACHRGSVLVAFPEEVLRARRHRGRQATRQERAADLARGAGGGEADRRAVRHRARDQRQAHRAAPRRTPEAERAGAGRSQGLDAGRAQEAVAPFPRGQGDGLHAQALGPLRPLPRRRPHLPDQQRRRARAQRDCFGQKVVAVLRLRPRRRAGGGDVHPHRHRQAQQCRSAGLARRCPRQDRRDAAEPARRTHPRKRSVRISLLRHPVSRRSRTTATCRGAASSWADSLADRRRISSSDRKRARPLRR